ncbi:hypothetical protein OIU81_02920 [Streptomyces sp. NBC_01454]|uniref:DUF7739 domain-containing protein n=1 Tax=Streptomyces sp. NBC_01454 TaxID=2975867 RepID=UPI002E3045F0|nr:hypothetical protein [Streptomyces sp. NBC_01454]
MGWTISHGTHNNGQISPSYRSISVLGQHLAYVLPASDWRAIEPVFGDRSGGPFRVPHNEARRIAAVLRRAASHRKMPADWGDLAREFADAAQNAANARQSWEWR